MNIWRIHLKTEAKPGFDVPDFCIKKGIVGIGWRVDDMGKPQSPEEYEKWAESKYKDPGWRRAANAMAKMEIDDIIWTRDNSGNYYVGRITSDWEYLGSENYDIGSIRKCEWYEVGKIEKVAGDIANNFIPPAAIQPVNSDAVEKFSKIIYNKRK